MLIILKTVHLKVVLLLFDLLPFLFCFLLVFNLLLLKYAFQVLWQALIILKVRIFIDIFQPIQPCHSFHIPTYDLIPLDLIFQIINYLILQNYHYVLLKLILSALLLYQTLSINLLVFIFPYPTTLPIFILFSNYQPIIFLYLIINCYMFILNYVIHVSLL